MMVGSAIGAVSVITAEVRRAIEATGLVSATPDTRRDMVVTASGLTSGTLEGRRDMEVAVV